MVGTALCMCHSLFFHPSNKYHNCHNKPGYWVTFLSPHLILATKYWHNKKTWNLFFLSLITIYFLNLLAIAILVITFHVLLKIQNNTKSLIHFKMAINNRLYVIKPAPIKLSYLITFCEFWLMLVIIIVLSEYLNKNLHSLPCHYQRKLSSTFPPLLWYSI